MKQGHCSKVTQLYAEIDGKKYSYGKERYWMYYKLKGMDVIYSFDKNEKLIYMSSLPMYEASTKLFGEMECENMEIEIQQANIYKDEKDAIMDKYSFGAFSGMIFNAHLQHPEIPVEELIKKAIEVRIAIRTYKVE